MPREEFDMKLLPGRDGSPACPRGDPCWQGLCGHSTGIEYDPVVSKWPPDLYPSRFKGACHVCWNRGVDSHTWQLLAHTALMLCVAVLRRGAAPRLMLLPLPVFIHCTKAFNISQTNMKWVLSLRALVTVKEMSMTYSENISAPILHPYLTWPVFLPLPLLSTLN